MTLTAQPLTHERLLSPAAEQVVTATAGVVAAHAEQITAVFYPSMFAAHPELLEVFNEGNQATGEQSKALAASVVAYAVHLIDPDAPSFAPVLTRIAHKHVSLGIRAEQYTIVGRHLMGAVATVLGDAVTPEVAAAWDEVYWLFATQLIAEEARLYAAASVHPASPLRPYRVVRRVEEARDVVSFVLEPADGRPLPEIRPGQYVSLFVTFPDGHRQPRQYTVSSTTGGTRLQVTVARVHGRDGAPDGRVSSYLHDSVGVGDLVDVGPPSGDVVVDGEDSPLLLVSAGAGVTTVLPVVEHLARTRPERTVRVAHADRTPADHALATAVVATGRLLDDFEAWTWYEDPDGSAPGARTGLMDLREVPLPEDVTVFTCGPLPFMRHVRGQLLARGVPADRIHYEVFGPDLWAQQPPA